MSSKKKLRRRTWGEDEQGRRSEVGKMNRRNNSKNADRDVQMVLTGKNRMRKKLKVTSIILTAFIAVLF